MRVPLFKRLSRRLRGHWRARVLGAHGIAVITDTKNGLLAVRPDDFNVSRALLREGEYDWRPVLLLRSLVGTRSRLIFAGAHIGSLLIPIVRSARCESVLAFEPSPNNFRLLTLNLALNALTEVRAVNAGLGAAQGRARFTENSINTGNSRLAAANGELDVAIETLDRSVPAEWESIDLIVMDIEGSEVAAMRGGRTILEKTQRFYVEFAPEQLREQGATAEEFLELAARFFKSMYIVADQLQFVRAADFGAALLGRAGDRGFLVNLLFTQDTDPMLESAMLWR